MKFVQTLDMGESKVDLKGQGHRSKVKVTRLFQVSFDHLTGKLKVKGHMGQGQRSHVSRSKVKLGGQGQRSRSSKSSI